MEAALAAYRAPERGDGDGDWSRLDEGFALFRARVMIPAAARPPAGARRPSRISSTSSRRLRQRPLVALSRLLGTGRSSARTLIFGGFGGKCSCGRFSHRVPARHQRWRQPANRPTALPQPNSSLATPAQLKLIYLTATRDLHDQRGGVGGEVPDAVRQASPPPDQA